MFGETARRGLLEANLGDGEADMAITGGRHVNVHSGEIVEEDIAIVGDRIAYVGDIDHTVGASTEVIEADGRYVSPGLVDGHLHSYHSYINGTEFAKYMLEHGTTAYADGFYGQGVVAGIDAVEFCKEEVAATPLSIIFLVPCIAHQQCNEMDLPPSPEGITEDQMHEMLEWNDCYGLEEPTAAPILNRDEVYLDLFERTVNLGKVVTGHAAGVDERTLNAYMAMGASTDHEMVTAEEAIEWLRRGMHLLGRYGSGARDVPELVKSITEQRLDSRNFGMSSDVLAPHELADLGSVDENIRVAIETGVDPITAVQAGSLTTAEALGVDHELGSIAPGKVADVLLVEDLVDFDIDTVLSNGSIVVDGGELVVDIQQPDYPDELTSTINLPSGPTTEDFAISIEGDRHEATVRTIMVEDGSYVTDEGRATVPVVDGTVEPSIEGDVLKAAMVNRHEASGRIGLGFVEGFGLDAGALGMSVNAVRENILVIGTNDDDMAAVTDRIADLQGGVVVVEDGEVIAQVPLALCGLQSIQPREEALRDFEELFSAIAALDCPLSSPLSTLEFIGAVPGIPSIRVSERGLIDATTGERLDVVLD